MNPASSVFFAFVSASATERLNGVCNRCSIVFGGFEVRCTWQSIIPGITVSTGPKDYFPVEQLQMMKFDGERWQFFGPILEGNLGSG